MSGFAEMRIERRRLAELAERLVGGIASMRLTSTQVAAVRWQLCRQLLAHLSEEDRSLYPGIRSVDRHMRGTGSAVDADDGFGVAVAAYLTMWTDDRVRRDSAGFCCDSIRILAAALTRLADERQAEPPLTVGTADDGHFGAIHAVAAE